MVCDSWLVNFDPFLFVSCFKVRYFVIVLFRALIGQLSLLCRFFSSFLFLSLARIKRSLPPSLDKKSPNYRHSLPYSWAVSLGSFSAKLGEHVVICINPAFTKMIDRTEKPKIPSKSALRAARYNEFRCKWINSRIEGDLPFSRKKNKRSLEGEERGFTYAWAEHYLQPNTVERHCA